MLVAQAFTLSLSPLVFLLCMPEPSQWALSVYTRRPPVPTHTARNFHQ